MRLLGEKLGVQAKAAFDRLFPERQIMQRSCGAVRGLRLSPGGQALAALGAVGVAGWCVYASATTLLEGPQPAVVANFRYERASYQRWLDDFRGRTVATREALADTTAQFERARQGVQTRHAILRALLEYARGARLRPPRTDRGDAFMVAAMNDNAHSAGHDAQQPRAELINFQASRRARNEPLGVVLGPASASAAPVPLAAAPPPRDFAAYIRDPALAARVNHVAARPAAMRRLGYD